MVRGRNKKSKEIRGGSTKPEAARPPGVDELVTVARGLTEGLTKLGGLAAIDELLNGLRKHRQFADLAALGTTLAGAGVPLSAKGRKLTAQGLIEVGKLEDAKAILDEIIRLDSDAAEVLEAHGLIGRIQKQVYVNGALRRRRDPSMLRSAALSYLTAFDDHKDHPYWHGINAAALLARAARDKVGGLPLPRAKKIAGKVRKYLVGRYPAQNDFWAVATIAEASLALDDVDQAELWYHRAAWAPDAEPFMLASALRQLREVWQLDPATPPGSRILPPLEARLYARGQTVMIAPDAAVKAQHSPQKEKVFGNSPFMPAAVLLRGAECSQLVCRVEDKLNQGFGTGFMVQGKLLSKRFPDELVLITNAHVMSPKGDGGSLTAAQAHVSFYANTDKRGQPHTSKIKKILWSSPPDALDATIATLEKKPPEKTEFALAARLPAADSKQTVYIIGHPGGGGLAYSLNDNELLDHGDPNDARVHYRTPTEPGSSGSPVFNAVWELIALHHAGDAAMEKIHGKGTYEANEGISFNHILPAIGKK
jgi:hypothetical protein